jgi:hypothetical protein
MGQITRRLCQAGTCIPPDLYDTSTGSTTGRRPTCRHQLSSSQHAPSREGQSRASSGLVRTESLPLPYSEGVERGNVLKVEAAGQVRDALSRDIHASTSSKPKKHAPCGFWQSFEGFVVKEEAPASPGIIGCMLPIRGADSLGWSEECLTAREALSGEVEPRRPRTGDAAVRCVLPSLRDAAGCRGSRDSIHSARSGTRLQTGLFDAPATRGVACQRATHECLVRPEGPERVDGKKAERCALSPVRTAHVD